MANLLDHGASLSRIMPCVTCVIIRAIYEVIIFGFFIRKQFALRYHESKKQNVSLPWLSFNPMHLFLRNNHFKTRKLIATNWFLVCTRVYYLVNITTKKSSTLIDRGPPFWPPLFYCLAKNPPIDLNGLHSFDGYQKNHLDFWVTSSSS